MQIIKKISYLLTFVFLFGVITSCQVSQKHYLSLLTNSIPSDTASVFGEGIISTENFEFAITFSPKMDELFFTRRKPEKKNEIYTMKLSNGKWLAPEVVFFKATQGWDFEPHINPTGNRVYFGSTRPLPDSTKSTGLHQWYCEKQADDWTKPAPLEKPFRDKSVIMYLTSSQNGNFYFTTGEKGDKPDDWCIYTSSKEKEGYKTIRRMGKEINSEGKWIAHSFIAPNESYMIYDFESESGFGEADLYISFNKNGTWTKPYNLGVQVNTNQTEMCASVSPDGKYLFFHRGGDDIGSIYWIDFRPIKERLENMSNNQN